MIAASILNYLKDFIVKSGEELEWDSSTDENNLLQIKIVRRSARIYRILGLLAVSPKVFQIEATAIPPQLENLGFTMRKRVALDDRDRQTFQWLEEGWIIKEVRFEKDEKTVLSTHYRMGFRLYALQQFKIQEKRDHTRNELRLLKECIVATLATDIDHRQTFSEHRESGFLEIMKIMKRLHIEELGVARDFPEKWTVGKRLKFLHFVHAFSQLSVHKKEFDWKEIGASYYQKIGGSKEFDSNKLEFIDQLEEWANVQGEELGLLSLGQITPVFFAGQLSGKYASFDWGPVHALTNISITNEVLHTKATTLWLVENRAIVTRMAATEQFLQDNHSLVISIDGQVRSAHRKVISQILNNSEVEQVLIWCDYDPSGLQISNKIYGIVNKSDDVITKWITPEQLVINNWPDYERHIRDFLEDNKMEQEQMIGGVEQWRNWIRS